MAEIPNNHPILDPPFARSQVDKHLSGLLLPAREVAQHAADLMLRLSQTGPRDVPDMIVIATMFRQCLVAYDGALILLENGAVQAAIPLNRALLEASLGMEWMLKAGKDRWARQYYVSSLRQSLVWLRRGIPGTDDHNQYAAALGHLIKDFDMSPGAVAARQKEEKDILALLSKAPYDALVSDIEAYRKPPGGKKRSEPNWYAYGTGAVANVAELAKAVGRSAEYVTFYKYGSYFVHGSLAESATHVDQGQLLIYPVRDLRLFPSILANIMTLMIAATVDLTQHYRHQELPGLRDKLKTWTDAAIKASQTKIENSAIPFKYGA